MTVKVRQWKRGKRVGFEVDIRFTYPDGMPFRRRIKAPVESKSAAKRWGEAKERELLMRPSPAFLEQQEEKRKEVPTLKEFKPKYMENHAKANREKASSLHGKERIFDNHLLPRLGDKRLDQITNEDVQALKGALAERKPKTVNNVLTVLGSTLRVAVKWKLIAAMPCSIDLLKVSNHKLTFYEFDEYSQLLRAAERIDLRTLVVVLLGGDAGLRRGEILALRWCDVDFARRQLHVQQAVWQGTTDTPKGGRGRIVPMTAALASALHRHRHLRGERVLYDDGGRPVRGHTLLDYHQAAQRRAGLRYTTGGLHILRHTFCSHLAMRGAPAKAIQELAGHEDLTTTMRYMHLSPAARDTAIRLLDGRPAEGAALVFGDIVESGIGKG
jgi:integrase